MPFPTTNATQELPALNNILASVGQAPVTTLDQTNPDVAIAYNTLLEVSREVQAEGWTFNREHCVTTAPDDNDNIFSSIGSPSFVAFMQAPIGLKLPIKEWIHTHPFGKAYFSGTDMRTINTWKTRMLSAIVFGDNEHQTWFKNVDYMEHHSYQRTEYIEFKELKEVE